jgi:hypothetical protein
MIEEREREAISRRKALSLLGLAGAVGLAVPPIVLAVSDAEAQAVPPAFNQVDKPIPGEENVTPRRIPRRKQVPQRRLHHRKPRAARPAAPPPQQPQPDTEFKPKPY